MEKGFKLKVREFWGLIPAFRNVTWEKLVGGPFWTSLLLSRHKFLHRRDAFFYKDEIEFPVNKMVCEYHEN